MIVRDNRSPHGRDEGPAKGRMAPAGVGGAALGNVSRPKSLPGMFGCPHCAGRFSNAHSAKSHRTKLHGATA